jgi:hypothetical protein
MPRKPKKSQRKKTTRRTMRREKKPSRFGSAWIVILVAALVAIAMAIKGF